MHTRAGHVLRRGANDCTGTARLLVISGWSSHWRLCSITAAAFGLAVLLEAIPTLYVIVKLIGAAYLIWLGVKLFRSQRTLVTSTVEMETRSRRRAIWESIVVEALNPKTALFYVAFLPQFTEPSASLPIWGQILILGTIVNFMFSATDAACVLLSAKSKLLLLTSQRTRRFAQQIGGSVLIALGVNLAVSRQ